MRSSTLRLGAPAVLAGAALLLGACGAVGGADVTASQRSTEGGTGSSVGSSSVFGPLVPEQDAAPVPAPENPVRPGRWALGDSVMLGALPALESQGFDAVAKESRQFGYAVDAVQRRAAKGTLPRNVVVHLGTNGTIDDDDCRAVVEAVGPDRRLFLVNVRVPRPWQSANNRELRACAAAAPERVVVVDWHSRSAGKTSWFYSDGIHLKPAGQKAYAAFVADAVDRLGL